MFNKTIDVIIKTPLQDIIDKKIIDKASQPNEFKNINIESSCPFSKFSKKFTKSTIRTCDGANDLFNKSLLLKSCADFYFKSEDQNFESNSPSNLFNVLAHPHEQIQVTPFKFYPKIMFPAFICTYPNIQFLLHKAYYHAKNDRIYPTGIVGGDFNPNIIFELEPNKEDFIDYLEPLVYFTALTDKKINVEYELITEQQFNLMKLKFEKRRFSRHTIG